MSTTAKIPVSTEVIDAKVALKAPLASPALTGTPTAPTAAAGTNTTQIATTAFVKGELSNFGLDSTGISLASTDDLDDVVQTGWYCWTDTPINAPKANIDDGAMCVDKNGVNIRQTVYRGGTPNVPELYIRYKNSTNAWSKWFTQSLESAAGAISLHVAPTGNDANDGLTSATPLLTINAAIAKISNNYLGYGATILLAEGSYAAFTLQEYNATTITISKEANATGTNVIVAGGTIQYNSNTFVFINNITITGALDLLGQQGPASYLLTNVLFDGGYINGRGPWCRINNCTFRNISTGEAIYFAEGFAMCEGLTIESTVAKGVVAASASVITVSTGSLTNNATIQYDTMQSGRIFVGTTEYGGIRPCNPNLLDNWYFVGGGSQQNGGQFPINQRTVTTRSAAQGYFIDRWTSYAAWKYTAELQSGGMRVTGQSNAESLMQQNISDRIGDLNGKKVTFSILTDEDGLISDTVTLSLSASRTNKITLKGNNNRTIGLLTGDTTYLGAMIVAPTNSYVTVKAIKLELGETQTLCHNEGTDANPVWVMNEIPNYCDEFIKCQRYLYLLPRYQTTRATAIRSNHVYFSIPVPVPLAKQPSIANASYLTVQNLSGTTTESGFTFSITQYSGPYIQIDATKTGHTCTDAVLSFGSTAPGVFISAEL